MQASERLAKLIVKLTSDHGPFVLAYGLQSCCEGTQLIAGILKFLFLSGPGIFEPLEWLVSGKI